MALDDQDFVASLGPDVPGCQGAGEADDQPTEQGRPEAGHAKAIQESCHQSEHGGIDNQQEYAHSKYGEWQGKNDCQGPDQGVHNA
jgi:hypothetical protein